MGGRFIKEKGSIVFTVLPSRLCAWRRLGSEVDELDLVLAVGRSAPVGGENPRDVTPGRGDERPADDLARLLDTRVPFLRHGDFLQLSNPA